MIYLNRNIFLSKWSAQLTLCINELIFSLSLKTDFQNPGKIWELDIEKAINLTRVWPYHLEHKHKKLTDW